MNMRECYAAMGADYEDVMRRLGNEERVRKFLRMVLKDSSFQTLCISIENNNVDEAFRASHSLKGICMNLGLSELGDSSSALTEQLRGGKLNERVLPLFERVGQDYRMTAAAIEALLDD